MDGAGSAVGEVAGGRFGSDEPVAGPGVVVIEGMEKWRQTFGQTRLIGAHRPALH